MLYYVAYMYTIYNVHVTGVRVVSNMAICKFVILACLLSGNELFYQVMSHPLPRLARLPPSAFNQHNLSASTLRVDLAT